MPALLGLVGFVLQNHFFSAVQAGVVKLRQPLCGFDLSDTIFRIFESTVAAGSGVLALLPGLTFIDFGRLLGRFRVH